MGFKFRTEYEGHTISITNSLTVCKMEIDGIVADVYFGLFMIGNVVMTGKLPHDTKYVKVKAVVGPRFYRYHAAIFVDEKLVYSSTNL